MLSAFSKSTLASRALWLTGALLLGVGLGQAQSPQPQPQPTTGDPFNAYHSSLSKAADQALAAPIQPLAETPRSELVSSPAPAVAASSLNGNGPAAINRLQQLRPIIEPILREEQVPTDLAAIVLVESGGQPTALSLKGARGLWQFMPDTARRYGLIVTPERDERLDVGRSTHAAGRYLRDLYRQFGNWELAFAAYNAGEDRVQHAIDRNGTRDFFKLSSARSMPLETMKYVPAVMDATRMLTPNIAMLSVRNRGTPWRVYADTRPSNGR